MNYFFESLLRDYTFLWLVDNYGFEIEYWSWRSVMSYSYISFLLFLFLLIVRLFLGTLAENYLLILFGFAGNSRNTQAHARQSCAWSWVTAINFFKLISSKSIHQFLLRILVGNKFRYGEIAGFQKVFDKNLNIPDQVSINFPHIFHTNKYFCRFTTNLCKLIHKILNFFNMFLLGPSILLEWIAFDLILT